MSKNSVTKARRRMDKLLRHLTDPSSGQPPLSVTPHRLKLRRELASAQKKRVKEEYGYDLVEDGEFNDPLIQYIDEKEDGKPGTKKGLTSEIRGEPILEEYREKLSKACHLIHQLGVAGSRINDDSASAFVPGYGYLLKPGGIRFEEVTKRNLILVNSLTDLPKLHADLYEANFNAVRNTNDPSTTTTSSFCIFSASNENCELVSITKEGLLTLCQDSLRVYGRVQRVDDKNLGARASRFNYRHVSNWLVKNRGCVCTGNTIESAFANLIFTTRACAFQVRTLAAVGGDLSRLDILSPSEAIKAQSELQERCSDETAANRLFQYV